MWDLKRVRALEFESSGSSSETSEAKPTLRGLFSLPPSLPFFIFVEEIYETLTFFEFIFEVRVFFQKLSCVSFINL